MDAPRNGTNSVILGAVVALGIAAVTGVIGWTFTHSVEASSDIARIEAAVSSIQAHQVQEDKWTDELNKKFDAYKDATSSNLGKINDAVNEVLRRSDGKNH